MAMRNPGEEQTRPYAAPANLISVLQRVRTRNLPERIDDDLLKLAGVPDGAIYRVANALRFLGLVDENDAPTDTLRALAGSPDEQYRELLAGVVRTAYQADFERVNPSEDTASQIVNAFRPYTPRSQTNRMVILFLGLCREAGIPVSEAPRERGMASPNARRSRSVPQRQAPRKVSKESQQQVQSPAVETNGLLFGVTLEDAAAMDQGDFDEVWAVLGKVVRARAQRKAQAVRAEAMRSEEEQAESDADEGGNS